MNTAISFEWSSPRVLTITTATRSSAPSNVRPLPLPCITPADHRREVGRRNTLGPDADLGIAQGPEMTPKGAFKRSGTACNNRRRVATCSGDGEGRARSRRRNESSNLEGHLCICRGGLPAPAPPSGAPRLAATAGGDGDPRSSRSSPEHPHPRSPPCPRPHLRPRHWRGLQRAARSSGADASALSVP